MKIKFGGALENLSRSGKLKIEEITVLTEDLDIQLWINDEMLSHLDLTEAISLRNELNAAIKIAAGI